MSLSPRVEPIKRKCKEEKIDNKREKLNLENDNFVKACEQVLKKVREDTLNRFLEYGNILRICEQRNPNNLNKINPMPPQAEETFNVEMRTNKWLEALQVSFLSITPTQCLSENVMKNIVEIMMNAHEDQLSEYHITYLIDKCQQVLSLNIRMHPPCSVDIRKYYKEFLTSPMDLREKTLTNRSKYGSKNGIFNYCINRLQHELSTNSKDGPFFNKEEERPEDVQQRIQEMHWVKSRLEIYEMLNRDERIDRLMAVMHSMAELLKFDLAFHQSGQDSRKGARNQKLLMTELLPTTSTSPMNDTCLQIMSIFIYFVHLNYPEKYIRTMSLWINILAEFLHVSQKPLYRSICDSYVPGKALTTFADRFYKIMADLPPESIIKILERITPAPIKYSIGILHVRKLLGITEELSIIPILTNFMENTQWNGFPETTSEFKTDGKGIPENITPDNILKQLSMICKNCNKSSNNNNNIVYLKIETNESDFVKDRHYVMKTLYITFRAYLDNYKVHRLQTTYDLLNLKGEPYEGQNNNIKKEAGDRYITSNTFKEFITVYRTIYIELKEYFSIVKSLKLKNELPETFCMFEKIIDFNEL